MRRLHVIKVDTVIEIISLILAIPFTYYLMKFFMKYAAYMPIHK